MIIQKRLSVNQTGVFLLRSASESEMNIHITVDTKKDTRYDVKVLAFSGGRRVVIDENKEIFGNFAGGDNHVQQHFGFCD